jgi:NAD(P)-dependent dehydrogenase (short-subunit alcohol dehydrogenase family)
MFEKNLLDGKVLLVTGGGTGLGKSMVERFLGLGARVAIASRKMDVLEKAAAQMSEATGGEVIPVALDVRDPEAIKVAVDQVYERFGKLDVLVNNAAGNFISPTERLSPRAVDAVLNIVLHGTFYCTLEVGRRWIEAGTPGTMLNIVTTYAETGSGFVVPSAAAKAGVLALTRSLAVEWARYNIRINAIAPGPFPTEGAWQRLAPTPEIADAMIRRIPMRRVGEHSELANLAAFLLSDQVAYINGECVVIDGGEWLRGAGQFNELESVTSEQWDMLAMMIKGKKD